MLNKKESLLRRDQAVSWLWACRKAGFNRDAARLIAKEVFDGFNYIHGVFDLTDMPRYTIQFENGHLIPHGDLPGTTVHGEMDKRWNPCRLCFAILKAMMLKEFHLNGRAATANEIEIIMEILHDTNCGVSVQIKNAGETTSAKTFGDIMKFSPQLDWVYKTAFTPDDSEPIPLIIIGPDIGK